MQVNTGRFQEWADMPIGPTWRNELGLIEANPEQASTTRHDAFRDFLGTHIESQQVTDQSRFVNLLEELVGMNYPEVAIQFMRRYPHFFDRSDYRCLLNAGIASLLIGEFGAAETYLRDAQMCVPEEPASYVNLCQLLWRDERWEEALLWARAGLEADRNHQGLWELLAVFLKHNDEGGFVETLRQEAEKRQSWAGISLAADLIDARDPYLKVEWLRRLYENGDRGEGFLIEFTAALGVAAQYQEIIDIVVKAAAEEDKELSWQLQLHRVQAFLALEKPDDAFLHFAYLSKHPDLPSKAQGFVEELKNEILESIRSKKGELS